jgi:hypothetical protein
MSAVLLTNYFHCQLLDEVGSDFEGQKIVYCSLWQALVKIKGFQKILSTPIFFV